MAAFGYVSTFGTFGLSLSETSPNSKAAVVRACFDDSIG